ncbi:digestive organ expansion factor, partial [Phlyctochytrium arcticum]
FTPLQAALFRHMNNYQDILHTQQTHATTLEIRRLYCLHAVNHVLKTRDRVLKNSAKLKAAGEDGGGEEWRDQGFTRPKVLILAPFKNNALEIVNLLIELSGSTQQDNKKRFMDEFGIPEEEDVLDPKKPADHQKTFAGNIDDCFRIGIKFARRQMKLFAPFYSSDVIVASPLGLRMVIGAEGDKKRDYDFLSAIEVVILDQTDVFLMQNWDHVSHIFDHLNQIPKDAHGCDFSRVRAYYLDSNAKYLRQTLLFSSLNSPDLNSLFAKSCKNTAGKIKTLSPHTGTLSNVLVPVPQLFQRIPCSNPAKADDARFAYFVERVLPTLRSSIVQQAHSMIFIPTYFDYVRVRNYLKEHKYEFAELSEYTPTRDISRARGDFFHGKISYVLTTERFHFFRRYHIRGIRHLVFYGLPEYPHFYSEMLNMMDHTAAGEVGVTALFTQYDRIKVERIVGTRRVAKLTDGQKDAIMFT